MKTLYLLFIILIFPSIYILAQWNFQNSGLSANLYSIYFLNENLGWVCGYDGTSVKTTNGGMDWVSLNIGALQDIHALFFIDSLVGGQ